MEGIALRCDETVRVLDYAAALLAAAFFTSPRLPIFSRFLGKCGF
jgi:hypothetical protein